MNSPQLRSNVRICAEGKKRRRRRGGGSKSSFLQVLPPSSSFFPPLMRSYPRCPKRRWWWWRDTRVKCFAASSSSSSSSSRLSQHPRSKSFPPSLSFHCSFNIRNSLSFRGWRRRRRRRRRKEVRRRRKGPIPLPHFSHPLSGLPLTICCLQRKNFFFRQCRLLILRNVCHEDLFEFFFAPPSSDVSREMPALALASLSLSLSLRRLIISRLDCLPRRRS